MGNQAGTTVVIVLLLAVLVAGIFVVPRFMGRRAIRDVVTRFRNAGATSPDTATTLEALGIQRKGLVERSFSTRDYKPQVTRTLADAGIIRVTQEGKAYLSEETLAQSNLKDFVGGG